MKKVRKTISQILFFTMGIGLINFIPVENVNQSKDEAKEIYIGAKYGSNNNFNKKFTVEPINEQKEEINSDLQQDSDKDGLEDEIEKLFGADPEKADTDGDGLDDFLEIRASLNPTKVDTDDNGIADIDEDTDKDGLTNGQEIALGTNCLINDTDKDGLSDSEELKNYSTSPLSDDTDGDTILDRDEIKLGLNPNSQYTDGVTKDSEVRIYQNLSQDKISEVILENNEGFLPAISGTVPGALDKNVYVNSYDTTPIENIEGLVGGAVNIESKYENKYSLNLKFDASKYLENNKISDLRNLVICRYDNNEYVKLDTKIDSKTLSTNINEGGIYFILNLEEESNAIFKTQSFIAQMNYVSGSIESKDSDYDGIEDLNDSLPSNNNFSGTLKTGRCSTKVSYTMDYRNFFASKKQYNSNIATMSSLFAACAYNGSTYNGLTISQFMAQHGIKDIQDYKLASLYNDSDLSEAYIGHKKVTYNGVTKEIIVVVVRGTNETIEEWTSNFDIGSTAQAKKFPDWKVKANHKGFDVATTRILKCLDEYESKSYLDKNVQKTYWVMGHSRGAGIANLIGARLIDSSKDVYTYTFAAPNTTTASDADNEDKYKGIYNVINKEDFVSCLPVKQWGFKHYGKSYVVSISANYEKEWEALTGIKDYNPDTIGMDKTLDQISKIINNRNDAYVYTCRCHGDGSKEDISIKNYGTSKKSREGAIAKIPSNALPYCKITRYNGKGIAGWDFKVCQEPEYFMQLLAAFMANKINAYRFVVELNIADRYEAAKLGIIKSGIGGLAHPHYNESYYLLTKHI